MAIQYGLKVCMDAMGVAVKASKIEKGDVVFSPTDQPGPVKEVYYAAEDVIVISFDGQFGLQCHPDTELLVARKGQIW